MKQVLRVLEYEKIKQQLQIHVSSLLGEKKVNSLVPSVRLDEVKKWQRETAEGLTVLRLKGHVPLGGIEDVTAHVKRAQIGGSLTASELISVAKTVFSGRRLKNFIIDLLAEDEELELPYLYVYVDKIEPL